MGEYAKRLKDNDYKAILFLRDYFTLSYEGFKDKYKLLKEKISKPITQKRYNKIFEKMSDEQKEIITDTTTKAMMILAGPGSGKTKDHPEQNLQERAAQHCQTANHRRVYPQQQCRPDRAAFFLYPV